MGKFAVNGGPKRRSNRVKTCPWEGHKCRSESLLVPVCRQNITQDKFPTAQFICKTFQVLVGT